MTPTDLIAAATRILETGGYEAIRRGFSEWNTTSTRLFEDRYSVVGIAVFATTGELLRSWADLQGALVDVISRHVGHSESKAWDGYLVLLTTGIAPSSDAGIEDIRSDTTRVRKLVATGEELSNPGDVERLLRSLLPLRNVQGTIHHSTALELLPQLLAEHGINSATTELLVASFVQQEPMMNALHMSRASA